MTTTLNASTSSGLVATADTSGALALQTAGTTALTIDTSANVNVATGNITFASTSGAALRWQNGYQTITGDAGTDVLTYRSYTSHVWKTLTGAGSNTDGTERMRVNGNGIGIGAAVPSSGVGITFPATQSASSDANTLDDYEEGTWLPNVGGTATYGIQTGRYTKVGNVVTVLFDMNISSIGTGSTTNILGLPFTALVTTAGSVTYYETLSRAYTFISCYAGAGTTIITPTGNNATATTTIAFNGGGSFQNNSRIIGSITYIVS
jgi:hypothetical protein